MPLALQHAVCMGVIHIAAWYFHAGSWDHCKCFMVIRIFVQDWKKWCRKYSSARSCSQRLEEMHVSVWKLPWSPEVDQVKIAIEWCKGAWCWHYSISFPSNSCLENPYLSNERLRTEETMTLEFVAVMSKKSRFSEELSKICVALYKQPGQYQEFAVLKKR